MTDEKKDLKESKKTPDPKPESEKKKESQDPALKKEVEKKNLYLEGAF